MLDLVIRQIASVLHADEMWRDEDGFRTAILVALIALVAEGTKDPTAQMSLGAFMPLIFAFCVPARCLGYGQYVPDYLRRYSATVSILLLSFALPGAAHGNRIAQRLFHCLNIVYTTNGDAGGFSQDKSLIISDFESIGQASVLLLKVPGREPHGEPGDGPCRLAESVWEP